MLSPTPLRSGAPVRPLALALAVLLLAAPAGAGAALALKVDVSGVSGELLDNVMAYLRLARQQDDPALTEARLRRLHQAAPDEIKKALEPFGYYHTTVTASLKEKKGRWRARYTIDPGPRMTLATVDVQLSGPGENDPVFQQTLTTLPLAPGAPLDHRDYEKSKARLESVAAEHGYFDFRFTRHELRIDRETNRAAAVLYGVTGPRYRFGPLRLHQDILEPGLLERLAAFKVGKPYSTTALLELQSTLLDSDYFANVDIQPRRADAAGERIPIDVTLTPRPRHRYSAGLGYGTDTGPRGRLGYENRRVNRQGHRFNAAYEASAIRNSLILRYSWPIRDPRTDEIALSSRWLDDHPDTSTSESYALDLSRTVSRGNKWLETAHLTYQSENYTVGGSQGDSVLLIPGIGWSKIKADRRIHPRRGWRLLFDVRGAHDAVLSDTRFLQLRGQAKFIRPLLGPDRLLLRGEAGWTRHAGRNALPASVRFFTGGDQSVRGFAYNSLSPKDASGRATGGEQMLVGSVEYEVDLAPKWALATFFDTGNAMDNWQASLKKSVGIGLRWRSPIGPVRLDIAWAVSEPNAPQRLHLNMGPDL
ncbi:MAG TPA: outer membrane protein assembly factor [Gammaproteobacteria bacterium]|nr:outer membrane protein assembly factor [Gammaproteobacteria bacterium]